MFLTNFYENMKIVPLFHLLTPSPFPITIQIMKYFCSFCTIFRTVKYKMKPKENKLLLHARYQECLDQTCKFFTYFQVISYSSIVLFGRWDLNTLGKCKHNCFTANSLACCACICLAHAEKNVYHFWNYYICEIKQKGLGRVFTSKILMSPSIKKITATFHSIF